MTVYIVMQKCEQHAAFCPLVPVSVHQDLQSALDRIEQERKWSAPDTYTYDYTTAQMEDRAASYTSAITASANC